MKDKDKDINYEKEHQKEYFELALPELDSDRIVKKPLQKISAELDIPDIGEEVGKDINTTEKPEPISEPDNSLSDENLEKLDGIKDTLNDAAFVAKLSNLKEEILDEVSHAIMEFRKELDAVISKQVPKRKQYDTGGAYKEQIYLLATKVLDEVLLPLFEEVPDYHLITNQTTKLFDDGTVENGIVTVGITINKDGYRYDFKTDVPILNGLLNTPLYLQRGIKVIPLTMDAIAVELDSLAFRKLDVIDTNEKTNVFNNTGDNITRRPDNQKWYDINGTNPQQAGMPLNSKWIPNKDIRGRGI